MSARGRSAAKEASRLVIASTWHKRRWVGVRGCASGRARSLARERLRLLQPGCECFRSMEAEDAAGTWSRVAPVAKIALDPSGLVEERERPRGRGLHEVRQVRRVQHRLLGHAREGHAALFRLDDPHGLTVHQQQVVAGPLLERDTPEHNAPPVGGAVGLVVLDHPATRRKLRVNVLAGLLLRGDVRGHASAAQRFVGPDHPGLHLLEVLERMHRDLEIAGPKVSEVRHIS